MLSLQNQCSGGVSGHPECYMNKSLGELHTQKTFYILKGVEVYEGLEIFQLFINLFN